MLFGDTDRVYQLIKSLNRKIELIHLCPVSLVEESDIYSGYHRTPKFF